MKLNRYIGPVALLTAAMCVGTVHAGVESIDAAKVAAGTYRIDPSHVSVAGRIDHLGFSMTTVRFTKIAGSFVYDPQKAAASSVDVTIDTASLTSDWEARDQELRSPAFFNVAAFPTARFVANSLEKVDSSHAKVNGQLTLLGVTRPVQMDVKLIGSGAGMMNDRRVGLLATLRFNRSDFGMKAFLPAVGDAVEVTVDAEFTKQ